MQSWGVTPNDPGDADTGANNLQNYPVLASSLTDGSTTVIHGTLDSTPGSTFSVDLYANSEVDPSGYGEGEIYLGFVEVTTDQYGLATFSMNVDAAVPVRPVHYGHRHRPGRQHVRVLDGRGDTTGVDRRSGIRH